METTELLKKRKQIVAAAVNHQEPEYVPTMLYSHNASIPWAGKRYVDVAGNPQAYAEAVTEFCKEVWFDGVIQIGNAIGATPTMLNAIENPINSISPDGTTPEHVQRCGMEAGEYDQLIGHFNEYVSEVVLPRVHPALFENPEKTKKMLKGYAESRFQTAVLEPQYTFAMLQQKYGIPALLNMQCMFDCLNPLDIIFDYFRGFKGTLTDLRRQPKKVKEALDYLWEERCLPYVQKPLENAELWVPHMPHIPAYLSPKQFDEFYWPYMKQQYERVAKCGGKVITVVEGRWAHVWHHFLELPKDSVVLQIDDDDIFEAKKILGDHQIICGGLKATDTKLKSFDQIKDDIKNVVDVCAPGGGFLFCSDKIWLSPGDVNQTLIDTYNFVHEYSQK